MPKAIHDGLLGIEVFHDHTPELDSRYLKLDGSNAFDTPADGEVLAYNSSEGKVEWVSQNASNLWTQSGSDIYYNSGNVGIGTTSPRAKFVVSDTSLPQVNISNPSGLTMTLQAGTSYVDFGLSTSPSVLRISNGAPTGTLILDQLGRTIFGGVARVQNNIAYSSLNAGSTATVSLLKLDTSDNTVLGGASSNHIILAPNGIEAMRILSTGEVGIGTTAPSAKLDINGNVNISGYATASGSLALGTASAEAGSGNLSLSGNLHLSGMFYDGAASAGSAGYVLTTTGSSTAWASLSIMSVGNADTLDSLDSTQFLRSDTTDNYTSGTLTFDAATTLDINGGLSIADTDIALDGASTNLTATGNFSVNTDDLFVEKSTGEVGIGTTAPSQALDITGSLRATGNISLSGISANHTISMDVTNDTQGELIFESSSGSTAGSAKISSVEVNSYERKGLGFFTKDTADFTTGATEKMRLSSTGNLGIGTTSPSTKLHIGAGAMTLESMTAPSSPASDKAVLFLEATGTSPSRTVALKVKWQDGSTSTLASVTV